MKLISPGLIDIETRRTNNGAGYRWMAASESTRRTSRRVRTSESMVRGLSSGSGSTVLDDLFGEMSRLQLSPVRPKTYQFCGEMVFENSLRSTRSVVSSSATDIDIYSRFQSVWRKSAFEMFEICGGSG